MLIFPLFFFFFEDGTKIRISSEILTPLHTLRLARRTLLRLGDDATALSILQMFRGALLFIDLFSLQRLLSSPKELTRKMQSEGPQP